MTAFVSAADDLALHGARVLGFSPASRVAARYGLDPGDTEEALRDHEARGWVVFSAFGGSAGWSITDAGREENERRMSAELDVAGVRAVVASAHAEFIPLNRRFGTACTRWQIRPQPHDRLAFNDHTDWAWDERVLRSLTSLGGSLTRLCAPLATALARFGGYADRYRAALAMVDEGHRSWVDSPELDSCHTVWIQLHEDLLATLGIPRGSDG